MSSKNRNKEFLDTATRRVVADYTQNEPANLMERIHAVNRAFPGQSKQNIAYLLKNNDYDVTETIRRVKEEGATELIGEWSKNTSKKNKKKKRKDDPIAQKETPPQSANRPLNNFDTRPSSDSKPSKPIPNSNSFGHKPSTAPPAAHPHLQPPLNSYTPSLPLEGYTNSTYQHYPPVTDSLQPNHNVLTSSLTGPSNNIQFLLLQLQTHSSHLAQWQDMLQQRMDTSLQILQYVFQELQVTLTERHQLLLNNVETGKWKAQEIFEQRKKLAQKLTAQAKRAPNEGVAEQIKQFLVDKQNDQQLCDVYSLNIDHEALLAAVRSLGDIVNSIPHYSHWASNSTDTAHIQHPIQPQPQAQAQATYKPPPNKQPAYQVPDVQPAPVQNYSAPVPTYQPPPAPQPHTYAPEPEVVEQVSEQPVQPTPPEVFAVTSQVYEVTLNDPYSSDAKPVDLTSGARQKTSKQELEAARMRMQGMLDKQGRSMIVSDAVVKGPTGPATKRGGEKGGRGGGGGGNKGKGRNVGVEKRGPPAKREGWDSPGDQWDNGPNNGPTYSAEFTNSNLEGDPEALDAYPEFVPSLVLTNNNYDNSPDETAPYDSVTSVASTEFKPTRQDDISPEEYPVKLNSFVPSQPEETPADPLPPHSDPDISPNIPEQSPEPILNWDDDGMTATDWGLDHEDS